MKITRCSCARIYPINEIHSLMKFICFSIVIIYFVLSAPMAPAQDFILGENDILTITVYDHPDLKTTVRISGDGMITLPLIGQVPAADMSVNDLAEQIKTLLSDGYVINPQVHIFVEEFSSRKATILGEVSKPGLYELKGQTTLLELISRAGGLTGNAANRAIIHRKLPAGQNQQMLTIDLRQLMEHGERAKNINIIDGDNILIQRKEIVYITGQVKKPDLYNYDDGLTLLQALTMAGGVTDKAATRRIRIIRTHNGQTQTLERVPLDQPIRPNDVIVVPESYF